MEATEVHAFEQDHVPADVPRSHRRLLQKVRKSPSRVEARTGVTQTIV